MKKIHFIAVILLGIIIVAGLIVYLRPDQTFTNNQPAIIPDALPKTVTLSGTYTCLPHASQEDAQTEECAFGLKTDDGEYYAVNFGQSADQAKLFQNGAHVTADGFIVAKEALSSDQWDKYTMKGIFTTIKVTPSNPEN